LHQKLLDVETISVSDCIVIAASWEKYSHQNPGPEVLRSQVKTAWNLSLLF